MAYGSQNRYLAEVAAAGLSQPEVGCVTAPAKVQVGQKFQA